VPGATYASCNNVAPATGTHFDATVGRAFSKLWSGNGNCTPWTSNYPAGYLGLTFTGATLSGTPTGTVTNYSFTVTEHNNVVYSYTITVNPAVSLSPASKTFTNAATVGTPYTSDLLTASNGTTPYTWSSGTLPAGGLCLKTTGGGTCPGTTCNGANTCYVAGTPTSSAPTSIPVTVTDVNGSAVTNTYNLTINSNICTTSSNGMIDFGTLNAVTNAGGIAESASYVSPKPTIYCTGGGATYGVTAVGANGGSNVGSGYKLIKGTDTITYSISYVTPITGQGTTVNIGGTSLSTDLNLKAGFAAGALNTAPTGTYTDTITFTINY